MATYNLHKVNERYAPAKIQRYSASAAASTDACDGCSRYCLIASGHDSKVIWQTWQNKVL